MPGRGAQFFLLNTSTRFRESKKKAERESRQNPTWMERIGGLDNNNKSTYNNVYIRECSGWMMDRLFEWNKQWMSQWKKGLYGWTTRHCLGGCFLNDHQCNPLRCDPELTTVIKKRHSMVACWFSPYRYGIFLLFFVAVLSESINQPWKPPGYTKTNTTTTATTLSLLSQFLHATLLCMYAY